MFGKSRPDPVAQENAILQCRVSLRRLQVKYRTMLEREMRIARELRAKNMSSPANDTKIKINYYMLREIDKTMTRLSEIRDTAQLNDAMNEFAGVLASVNQLSARVDKADGKAISKNIRKMNQRAEKEERQLSGILERMEKNAGPMEMEQGLSGMMEAGQTESRMAADPSAAGRAEQAEEEPSAMTQADLDEINRYVEEMIRIL